MYENKSLSFINKDVISDKFGKEILESIFQDELEWEIKIVRRFSLRSEIKFKVNDFTFSIETFIKKAVSNFNYNFKLIVHGIKTTMGTKKRDLIRKYKKDLTCLDILNEIRSFLDYTEKWNEIVSEVEKELIKKYKVKKMKIWGDYNPKGLTDRPLLMSPSSSKRPSKTFGVITISFKGLRSDSPFGGMKEATYAYTDKGVFDSFSLSKNRPSTREQIDIDIKELEQMKETTKDLHQMVEWYILNYQREKRLKKILENQKN